MNKISPLKISQILIRTRNDDVVALTDDCPRCDGTGLGTSGGGNVFEDCKQCNALGQLINGNGKAIKNLLTNTQLRS